jgi:hypothetical protein
MILQAPQKPFLTFLLLFWIKIFKRLSVFVEDMLNTKLLLWGFAILELFVILYCNRHSILQEDVIKSLSEKNELLNRKLHELSNCSKTTPIVLPNADDKSLTQSKKQFGGVAASLFTDHPAWFQRRYTFTVLNALANIPDDWAIQIFHLDSKQFYAGLEMNVGLKELITNSSRVILTAIPMFISKERTRPIHIMTHPWIWQNMVANKVLLFGGNHVICSNSQYKLTDFLSYDYIGSPWSMFKGEGGGGGISLRSRDAMLRIIDEELSLTPTNERSSAYLKWGRDDEFFVSRLLKNRERYILPSKQVPPPPSQTGV